MRRLLFLTGSIIFVDTLFFAALTPLLPHYARELGLGKGGAGVLAAAYPAGALVGAIPSGIVAARAGVKPTVLVGMTVVAATTAIFGLATTAWELDLARFCQGVASAFSWTGSLAWLVAAAPPPAREPLDRPGLRCGGRRAPCSARAGRHRVGDGPEPRVRLRCGRLARCRRVGGADAGRPPGGTPAARRSCTPSATGASRFGSGSSRYRRSCSGRLSVLAPLRLSARLRRGRDRRGLADGGRARDRQQHLPRPALRPPGPLAPIRVALVASTVVALALPWPDERFVLAAVVVCAGLAFGSFTRPG